MEDLKIRSTFLIIINMPLAFLNLMANLFFTFCLIFPSHGLKELKPPLTALLWSLVLSTVFYFTSLIVMHSRFEFHNVFSIRFFIVLFLVLNYMLATSMTSAVLLNFFYCTQIVPAQRALSLWVKRNIKYIIYCALFVDRMFYLIDFTVPMFLLELSISSITSSSSTNVTLVDNGLFYAAIMSFYMGIFYSFPCLCVMTVSSFTTARYLHRHIRSMSGSGSPFSSPRLQSQVRVTITGILQGLFYVLGAVWILFIQFSVNYISSFPIDVSVTYTVVSLYMTGTTVNLAVGQALFRQRAAEVWLKVSHAVKSSRLCG